MSIELDDDVLASAFAKGHESAAAERVAYMLGGDAPSSRRFDPDLLARAANAPWFRRMAGKPCVYFVRQDTGGPIKIGWASELKSRLSALQTGNAHPLFVLAAVAAEGRTAEAELHARFDRSWIRGEWFRPTTDLVSHIESLPR